MGLRGLIATLLIAAGLAVFAVSGCGGGSSSSTAEGGSGGSTAASNEFAVPGGENQIAGFGKEASESEREAASAVLEENLKARASHDYAGQCASLGALVVTTIEKNSKGQPCAQALEKEGAKAPKAVLENTLEGPIDVLRVKGSKAYALWHGTGGKNYAMTMENENGQWKVAEVITTPLPTAAEAKAKAESEAKPKAESEAKTPPKSGG